MLSDKTATISPPAVIFDIASWGLFFTSVFTIVTVTKDHEWTNIRITLLIEIELTS